MLNIWGRESGRCAEGRSVRGRGERAEEMPEERSVRGRGERAEEMPEERSVRGRGEAAEDARKGGASEAEAGEQRFGKTDFLYQFFCLRHVPDMFPAMAVAG